MSLSNPVDAMAPWTIKAFPTDARQRIVRHAEIAGVTVGQFIERLLLDWEAGAETRVQTRSAFGGSGPRNEAASAPSRPARPRYSRLDALERILAIDPRLIDQEALQARLRARVDELAEQAFRSRKRKTRVETQSTVFQNGFAAIQAAESET